MEQMDEASVNEQTTEQQPMAAGGEQAKRGDGAATMAWLDLTLAVKASRDEFAAPAAVTTDGDSSSSDGEPAKPASPSPAAAAAGAGACDAARHGRTSGGRRRSFHRRHGCWTFSCSRYRGRSAVPAARRR